MTLQRTLKSLALAITILAFFPPFISAQTGDSDKAETRHREMMQLSQAGRYQEALPLARKVLALREKALGPAHLKTGEALNNLGFLLYKTGDLIQAEKSLLRALAILEKTLGPHHANLAVTFNVLAYVYQDMKQPHRAADHFQKALNVAEKAFGQDHPNILNYLGGLANFYFQQRDYGRTEPLFQRALAIKEKAVGPQSPELHMHLVNLARLYQAKGDPDRAESFFQRALAISEKAYGPEHLEVAVSLDKLAEFYRSQGDQAKARPLFERSLAIRVKNLGRDHLLVAGSLNMLGLVHFDQGDYRAAAALFQESLVIREKNLGPDHADVAQSLGNLAWSFIGLKEYAQAEAPARRAVAVSEKAFGLENENILTYLKALATYHARTGDYPEAAKVAGRALAISEKAHGPDHSRNADFLSLLAGAHRDMSDFPQAEHYLLRLLTVQEKNLGPEKPPLASTLSALAQLYTDRRLFDRAKPMAVRALAINEKTLGPEHPKVADSLIRLALVHERLMELTQAEALYQRALAIKEKVLGPDHLETADILTYLAKFYYDQFDWARSEQLHRRSLAIREKSGGPESIATANGLEHLAGFYIALGDYDQAEPMASRALAIRRKVQGPDHSSTAASLRTLAEVYHHKRDFARSEQYYRQALAVREKALGPDHPGLAQLISDLARLESDQGHLDQAEVLMKQVLLIQEKALGPEHLDVVATLAGMATFKMAGGRPKEASTLLERAETILIKSVPDHPGLALFYALASAAAGMDGRYQEAFTLIKHLNKLSENLIDQVLGFTAEDRQLKFLAKNKAEVNYTLGLVADHLRQDREAVTYACDLWLRRKGVTLEAQKRFQEALVYQDNPEAAKVFMELARVRSQLSQLAFSQPGPEDLKVREETMAGLKAEKERLEAALARLSQVYARQKKAERADVASVSKALPAGSVLLEFASILSFDIKRPRFQEKKTYRYLAFILPAGNKKDVRLVDLGQAAAINAAVSSFKKAVSDAEDIQGLKTLHAAAELYRLVFAPLKEHIGPAREIFISPDGKLNLIPFEVLTGPDGRFLIEDYSFNYLAAGRDVLDFGRTGDKSGRTLLLGDPDFDLTGRDKAATMRQLGLSPGQTPEKTGKRSLDMVGLRFGPLPGTREEVKAIQALLGPGQTRVFTGREALEEVLRQGPPPRILHLATHGFFLDDDFMNRLVEESSAEVWSGPDSRPVGSQVKLNRVESPLIRSGLALAGANQAVGSSEIERSDGLLTAEKVLGLKLNGTELVVLSACETGVGEVKSGEGVYGLRRAFTLAGAKSLVMSLWPVPDLETKELMTEFYRHLAEGKLSRAQALRQAALKQKHIVQNRYGHVNPLFWAAFIMLGDPGY
ncbi:MAG: tetratricopeptide repeat protein [Thermodesulfobacteriota bacterium]